MSRANAWLVRKKAGKEGGICLRITSARVIHKRFEGPNCPQIPQSGFLEGGSDSGLPRMEASEQVRLAKRMYSEGWGSGELTRQLRAGSLVRVRHGAYAETEPDDAVERHRRLIAGTIPRLRRPAAVSHVSAAVLHGLPVWPDELARVHVTRNPPATGHIGRNLHVHATGIEEAEIMEIGGNLVTTMRRTVADVARSSSYERSVAVADAAARSGLDLEELRETIPQESLHCAGQSRRVAAFADGRAESVGESFSRVALDRLGTPAPELQYTIIDPATGLVIGRADFAWPELRTLGEFDGKIKYGRLLKPGETISDVIFAEKLREDALRNLGWEIVRWIWEDLHTPLVLRSRLQRAFDRGSRQAFPA